MSSAPTTRELRNDPKQTEFFGTTVRNPTAKDIAPGPKSRSTSSSTSMVLTEYSAAPSMETLGHIIMAGKGFLIDCDTEAELERALDAEAIAGTVAFVIPGLNPKGGKYQAYVQTIPQTLTHKDELLTESLQAGLEQTMETNLSSRITEAVGEAAAALYMLKHFPAAKMIWGAAVHEGPGIDQIWISEDAKGVPTYYIVEAKGPGANLRDDQFVPKGWGTQMSLPWVLHHFAEMGVVQKRESEKQHPSWDKIQHYAIAGHIMKEIGLTPDGSENPDKGSKRYYKCKYHGCQHGAKLYGLVIKAKWTASGLDGTASFSDYSNELLAYLNKTVQY